MRMLDSRCIVLGCLGLACATDAWAGGLPRIAFVEAIPIADHSEGLTEPSGLAVSNDGRHLWTVSDDTERIFLLGLDGDLKRKRSFRVDGTGFEGIAADPTGKTLLAVSEDTSEIIVIDIAAEAIVRRHALSGMAGYEKIRDAFEGGGDNNGLEGITIDPSSGNIFLLKERAPRLMIEISSDLTEIREIHVLSAEMGFADGNTPDPELDVSGLVYDSANHAFWIVSDTGRMLCRYLPNANKVGCMRLQWTDGKHLREIKNAEGVAIDSENRQIYIVNDDGKNSMLFIFAVTN